MLPPTAIVMVPISRTVYRLRRPPHHEAEKIPNTLRKKTPATMNRVMDAANVDATTWKKKTKQDADDCEEREKSRKVAVEIATLSDQFRPKFPKKTRIGTILDATLTIPNPIRTKILSKNSTLTILAVA
mmetsp:Transcript_39064/g.102405  ORF Transcript_39064/g.102405 Transcript_39064/m.102405 type:complete len:129 (+) Transcript_39064:731-1117(+)